MKRVFNEKILPVSVLLLGIAGCALRAGLYAYGVDHRGLLVRLHPTELGLWLTAAVTVALVLLAVRRMDGPNAFDRNFRYSLWASMGHILLASGILLTVLTHAPSLPGLVGKLWKLLGVASAPLLFYGAFSRVLGKKPNFLCYVVTCVFFAFHLVCHYRVWCSDPQLQNYLFDFIGTIGLMVFAYYQAAFCVGSGSRRHQLTAGLLTGYLCIVNLPTTQYLYLYLGGAVWALTGLCALEAPQAAADENAAA